MALGLQLLLLLCVCVDGGNSLKEDTLLHQFLFLCVSVASLYATETGALSMNFSTNASLLANTKAVYADRRLHANSHLVIHFGYKIEKHQHTLPNKSWSIFACIFTYKLNYTLRITSSWAIRLRSKSSLVGGIRGSLNLSSSLRGSK
jgi:hypothetical protein